MDGDACGIVINRGRKDDEGFTACRSLRWREFTKPVAEFGERVMCAPVLSVSDGKFDARWENGVRLGTKAESGESLIGTSDGVAKARDVRERRWVGRGGLRQVQRCTVGGSHMQEQEQDMK